MLTDMKDIHNMTSGVKIDSNKIPVAKSSVPAAEESEESSVCSSDEE